jgi:hypothetical protein
LKVFVRSVVFTAVTMKNSALWDVALCRSCLNRRFGRTYYLKFASEEPAWTWAGSSFANFLPWRWRRYVVPKRRFTQDLHKATSQNTTLLNGSLVIRNKVCYGIRWVQTASSLYLFMGNKRQVMKTCEGVALKLRTFMTSAVHGRCIVSFTPK